MRIERDDLTRPAVQALLAEHLAEMHAVTPPGCVFALDLDGLRAPEITFWTIWEGSLLLGCGALKELSPTHGEVKSMRTPTALRGRGAGWAILERIIAEARGRGYRRLSLETGANEPFHAAHLLYERTGFLPTGPFGEYVQGPNNRFMTLEL